MTTQKKNPQKNQEIATPVCGLVRNDGLIISEIGNLAGFQLKLQFISDQGDELRIGGFSFGIGNRVPEKPLQSIQISTVPGDFNGMADGRFGS